MRVPHRPAIPTRCSWCASRICATCSTAAAISPAGPTRTTSGRSTIALDPERGRVLLGADRVAEHASEPFTATFHYGFSRDIGGGEYERTPAEAAAAWRGAHGQRRAVTAAAARSTRSAGGRLLIDDSLTYEESPTFKAPADADPERPGAVVGARNGARPLIAASARHAAADRRERHAGARRPGDRGRRTAACRRRPTTRRARWCCATARWCPVLRSPRMATRHTRRTQPHRRTSVRRDRARALHHGRAARGRRIRRHGDAQGLHRRCRRAEDGVAFAADAAGAAAPKSHSKTARSSASVHTRLHAARHELHLHRAR